MQIIKANKSHKQIVLELLDDFRTEISNLLDKEPEKSTVARENGQDFFDKIISSDDSAVFLAQEANEFVGITTVNKIPVLRKGYFRAEVEEMYVNPKFHGQGVAQALIKEVEQWAKENNIPIIHIESAEGLGRAHAFYKKVGYSPYGKVFMKKFN